MKFVQHRRLAFDRVLEKLAGGKYSRAVGADYSNLGAWLFDEYQFRDQLGVSGTFLRSSGLVTDKDQHSLLLPSHPSPLELVAMRREIYAERNRLDEGTRLLRRRKAA